MISTMIYLSLGSSKPIVSSRQVPYARLHTVMKNCFEFIHAIGMYLQSRFPDLQFDLQNLSFFNPENR